MTVSSELRAALDVQNCMVYDHRGRIEAVRDTNAHSVTYRECPEVGTCVAYALGLFQDKTYQAISGWYFQGEIFAGKSFVEWLLDKKLLGEPCRRSPGCLVLYFADDVWQHIGIVAVENRVISKWGTFPVYEHELLEVPESYGSDVRSFTRPTPDQALKLFIEYAKACHGINDRDIKDAIEFER